MKNIAHHTAINLAYAAYQQWVIQNKKEPAIPELELTGNQMFWLSYATVMCQDHSHDDINPQSLINRPFRNSPYFWKDYNCPTSNKKCQILY